MGQSDAKERLDTRTTTDRLQVALHNQRYEFVLQHLARLQAVLEIGTGTGNLSVLLAGRCGNYVGVEFDAETCAVASERLGGAAHIVQGDARALPFEARSFSGIVCLEVLEHLGDFRAGIRNIHRCLREDGMAIISVPYRRRGGPSPTNAYHLYEPGELELIESLNEHFQELTVWYQYFEETPLMKVARRLHMRRVLGLEGIYRALAEGKPQVTSRLKISRKSAGMDLHLIVIVQRPKQVKNSES